MGMSSAVGLCWCHDIKVFMPAELVCTAVDTLILTMIKYGVSSFLILRESEILKDDDYYLIFNFRAILGYWDTNIWCFSSKYTERNWSGYYQGQCSWYTYEIYNNKKLV